MRIEYLSPFVGFFCTLKSNYGVAEKIIFMKGGEDKMQRFVKIIGWGRAVPENRLTSVQFSDQIGVPVDDIERLCGIKARYIAQNDQVCTSDLATLAARDALRSAHMDPVQIDLVVVCTCTPDHLIPATSYIVQDQIGAMHASAFDLNASCSGFVYGLATVSSMVTAGLYRTVLLIGADMLSKWIDWTDLGTSVLFGDGAGAVILQVSDEPGFLAFETGADGARRSHLLIPGGGTKNPPGAKIHPEKCFIVMDGSNVYRFAINVLRDVTRSVINRAGLVLDDIDLIIPHQANMRILTSSRHELPQEKIFINIDKYGNTSAASIPIAICDAVSQTRIKKGDNICLIGFGGGLGWAATVLKW